MQNNLFDDLPALPEPQQPVSVLALFEETLPLSIFLVSFAKQKIGYKARHQKEIVHAMVELLAHGPIVSTADIEWWIAEGIFEKKRSLYTPLEQLVAGMDTLQRRIARRAAINLVGPTRSDSRLRCLELIDTLFPP